MIRLSHYDFRGPSGESLVCQTQILNRGWTVKAIKDFLGVHEDEKPNPHDKLGWVKLWPEHKVQAAERTPEFRAWKSKIDEARRRRREKRRGKNDAGDPRPTGQ
jgi:hypothetical protein